MDRVHLSKASWEDTKDHWKELVKISYHESYDGAGAIYSGVSDLETKIAAMQKYAEFPGMCVWIATIENNLVGLVCGTVEKNVYVIWDLFVSPSFRRRGVGRPLIETSIRESGCRKVRAEVRDGNSAGHASFSALGFVKKYSATLYEYDIVDEKPREESV